MGWPGVSLLAQLEDSTLRRHYPLSVKSGTSLQLKEAFSKQLAARTAYVESALSLDPGPSPVASSSLVSVFLASLKALWSLSFDNVHKEPLWRLSVNGIRGAGGHGIPSPHPCPCLWSAPPAGGAVSVADRASACRAHSFWSCPVAVAIRSELEHCLHLSPGSLPCSALWLLRAPVGVPHQGVWEVVGAAAIAAMSYGRKLLIRLHLGREPLPHGQTRLTDFGFTIGGLRPSVLQRASRKAVAWFWCILQDFVSGQDGVPPSWGPGPTVSHPFMARDPSVGAPQLVVFRPP